MANVIKSNQFFASGGNSADLSQTSRWKGKDVTVLSSALLGSAVGGAIGSMFGPLGTVAGAVVGVALGLILGFAIGSWIYAAIDRFRIQSEKREEAEFAPQSPPQNDIPEWAIDPVMRFWKAAQIIKDLTIAEMQKELSIGDFSLILEVYQYCLDPKMKEHLPAEQISSIITWVEGCYQEHVNLNREQYLQNWNSSERIQFATETIENHPRFHYYPQEVKDRLIHRLYNSALDANTWKDLRGSWLLQDITVSAAAIQKV